MAVVVLNWNGGDDTLCCLRSVMASDLPGLRVYLADNGSTDGSVARVRAALPPVRIVENGANLGYAGGNNRGWRAAAADGATRVLFLNNDAVLAPDTLRLLCQAMDADPGVGAASPRILRGRGSQDDGGGVWFEKGGTVSASLIASGCRVVGAARALASSPCRAKITRTIHAHRRDDRSLPS